MIIDNEDSEYENRLKTRLDILQSALKNNKITPLSTLYNSLILKGLKFNNFLAKNCKPSIYRALEKRVESQVNDRIMFKSLLLKLCLGI